jgi:diguanylate cyclase (GGDEF)-like protein
MHYAFSTPRIAHHNKTTVSSLFNERLMHALKSAGQIAFDWKIADNELMLTSGLCNVLRSGHLPFAEPTMMLPEFMHEQDHSHFRTDLRNALKAMTDHPDMYYRTEVRLRTPQGDWRWVAIRGRIVERDAAGRALRMAGTFSDIHERRSKEEDYSKKRNLYIALNFANQAIVRIKERDKLFAELCRIVVEHGGFRAAWIDLMRSGDDTFVLGAAHEQHPVQSDAPVLVQPLLSATRRLAASAVRRNEAQVWNDCLVPRLYAANGSEKPTATLAVASFPFFAGEHPVGTLNLCSDDAGFFNEDTLMLLQELTTNLSCSVQQFEQDCLQRGQNHILNLIATGSPLHDILQQICRFVEERSGRVTCRIIEARAENPLNTEPALPGAALHRWPISFKNSAASQDAKTHADAHSYDQVEASRAQRRQYKERSPDSTWPILGHDGKNHGKLVLGFQLPGKLLGKEREAITIACRLASIAIEGRVTEERIRFLAHYDGLTGLPNRFLFKEYFDLALRSAQRHGKDFAVLFLDLDKFKEVNDTLGHEAGDKVLTEIARRLKACLRHTDKIARMGGDEFYILIEELEDGCHAADVAEKLLAAASHPVQIGEHACQLSVSIGISLYPTDGNDEDSLIRHADAAMYKAKGLGRNAYQFFNNVSTFVERMSKCKEGKAGKDTKENKENTRDMFARKFRLADSEGQMDQVAV